MPYFDSNFIDFFVQLSANNNKEWFHAHKNRYETFVKAPFEKFVTALLAAISKHENLNGITAKECILRINRDIRFSKDKSPYNTHVTAFVSKGGGKDKSIPGLYLRFAPDMVGIMGGCYSPSSEQLYAIRNHIKNHLSEFESLYSNKTFFQKFENIKGEAIKRVPEDLKPTAGVEKLILNKQWYFVAERETALLFSKNLLHEIMGYYFAAKPLNDFLRDAITLKSV
jgi:uncharacterized protein (TIGR02453 family)